MSTSLADLQRSSVSELEQLFRSDVDVEIPRGVFRGVHLKRLDNPGANDKLMRWVQFVGWEAAPFGIDFDDRRWFFFDPRWRIGRFRPVVGDSRWRATQAVALHYEVSRLPRFVRCVLYDEVKPLGPDLCLGLGGTNAERDKGDHFFFALTRLR